MGSQIKLHRIKSPCRSMMFLVFLYLTVTLWTNVIAHTEHYETFESAFGLNTYEQSAKEDDFEKAINNIKPIATKELEELASIGDNLSGIKEKPEIEILKPFIPNDTTILKNKPNKESPSLLSIPGAGERNSKYVRYDSDSPDADRYAPRSSDSNQNYVITEARLKEIRSKFMYWYFDLGGDNEKGDYQSDIHASTAVIHKNLNFQLPFFGFRYNYTRLSLNGLLEFSDPPAHYMHPLVFPVKDWPESNDPSFIAIFFSLCRIGLLRRDDIDKRKPGVYFRLERDLQKRTDQFGVEVRERVKWDIRSGVVGSDSFDPKHVIICTWKNVSFVGGSDNSLYTTNTFQMVLVTDEVFTYAIYNYLDLQWTADRSAGGDGDKGEGGVPAFIGFNAGNGTQSYEYKPYSQSSAVRDLTGRGWANDFPGRHIFRIDEKIMLGTCNKDIAGTHLPLVFAPESGNMLGGTVVNITGPCFNETEKVRCLFDTEIVLGHVIDKNRAICVQPFVHAEGYVRFEVAVGDTGTFNWKGKYFIETPATASEKISFTSKAVHQRDPAEIKITWNQYNFTSNLNAGVQISLWGYRETKTTPELEFIADLEKTHTNIGWYIIRPSNYRDFYNPLQQDMVFGFIKINLTNPTQYSGIDVTPILWSKPVPLAWYFAPQWERLYGSRWPQKLCDTWIMNDRYLKNFAAEIDICPCTLDHALYDKGRFLPDFDCDKDSNPDCFYNEHAIHCVRTGAPNLEGSEQQCCYDKNGYLMLTYDQKGGSRPRRSHNLGYFPWNEADKVPTLSHWYHDMVPMYVCCMWQEEQAIGCETLRFERRPTQDCIAYQSPAIATVFGDPHVVTFDGVEYTFNGKGEYVLVRVDQFKNKLDVQARFEQVERNYYGPVNATKLTSIAVKGNDSAIIEVRLRPKDAQWRYRLDVFANKRRIYFDRPSLKFQHFAGVVVYTPTYILNQSEVIVMMDTGAGVEVVENEGFMSVRVYLPWKYMNKTRGLMGNWSHDITDDFTNPDGQIASIGNLNSFEDVHKNFASNWLLEDKEVDNKGGTLFTREFGRTASFFYDRNFKPEFRRTPEEIIPENRTEDRVRANAFCGDSYQCKYDYAMTLNRDFAHFTKNYYDTYTQIRAINENPTISCGVLETPRFGRKSNFLFVPGAKVTFECNQNFVLIGDQRRECTPEGRWNLPEYGYTECLRRIEYVQRTAWTTMGIISAVLIPAVGCIACVFLYIRKNQSSGGSTKSWRYSERGSGIDNDSALMKQPPSLKPYDRAVSLISDSSITDNLGTRKRRSYDKVYRTHEPLPDRPYIDFEDKEWDLKEPVSPTESEITIDSTQKTVKEPVSPTESETTTDSTRKTGQQEHSSRQAGISTGIILACIVPIVLVIVCIAHRVFKNRRQEQEQDETLARTRQLELQRMRKIGEDDEPAAYTSKATDIN